MCFCWGIRIRLRGFNPGIRFVLVHYEGIGIEFLGIIVMNLHIFSLFKCFHSNKARLGREYTPTISDSPYFQLFWGQHPLCPFSSSNIFAHSFKRIRNFGFELDLHSSFI